MNYYSLILVLLINIAITLAVGVYKVNINSDPDSYLNVRSGPGYDYSVVGSLKRNQLIYVTTISGEWAKFYKGYVSTTYIKKATGGSAYRTNVDLNFRTGPTTDFYILKTLKKGTGVTYYGRDPWNSGWGVTNQGYCSMQYGNTKYLVPKSSKTTKKPKSTSSKKTKSSSTKKPTPKPKNKKIELKTTPLYQCDYGYSTYGPNGCSLCDTGCLVTSLTMMYNQIKKTSYKPTTYDDFMSFNGCSASGYGPYGTKFSNPQYISQDTALNNLLNSLKKNRIAVFGSVGNQQHFVAVYGYVGDYKQPLKPKDFLIHDPYSKNRRYLSEHIYDHWAEFQTITLDN